MLTHLFQGKQEARAQARVRKERRKERRKEHRQKKGGGSHFISSFANTVAAEADVLLSSTAMHDAISARTCRYAIAMWPITAASVAGMNLESAHIHQQREAHIGSHHMLRFKHVGDCKACPLPSESGSQQDNMLLN